MKKNIIKISALLITVILLFSVISNAGSVEQFTGTIHNDAVSSKNAVVTIISTVLQIIRTIGLAIAVTMLMTIACKYIIASAGDRADIKKYAINYVIGALILFGASGLVTIAKNFIDSSFNS